MPTSLFEKSVSGYLASLYILYLTIVGVSAAKPQGFGWNVSAIGLPMFELIFFGVAAVTLWRLRSTALRYLFVIISLLLLIFIGSIYLVQIISVMMSGQFITVLAMENAGEFAYVANPRTIALSVGVVSLMAILIGAAILESRTNLPKRFVRRSGLFGFVLIFLLGTVYSEMGRIAPRILIAGFSISLDKQLAPISKMHMTYEEFSQARFDKEIVDRFVDDVSRGIVTSPFPFDPKDDFPFQQTDLNLSLSPFLTVQPEEELNVIVLFLEGVSARVMGHYGGPYTDLTPNLDEFAAGAITVDDYYNHTAATYRGLQGSLASGFPLYGGAGGWEKSIDRLSELSLLTYATLPIILNAHGYDTRMFSPHRKEVPFDKFLYSLGFTETVTLNDVKPGSSSKHLRDRELFAEMAAALDARDRSGDKNPFFWSSYNVGSHAFFDTPVGAKAYGDGTNSALNRFHELDESVSQFLDAFEASSFTENTLLIITADHAAYPEPPVVEAFKNSPQFSRYFVDQIPLIIRVPGINKPMRFANGVRTSLDLAPTVLHLLNFVDQEHAFLGTSVFDEQFEPNVNWGMIGTSLYSIDETGVTAVARRKGGMQAQLVRSAIAYYNQLEEDNRVFNPTR